MLLTAATYDEAINGYTWFTYTGKRGFNVMKQAHNKTIRAGDVYGLKHIRGGNAYVILPEMYHVNFTVLGTDIPRLERNSKQKRKPPRLVQQTGQRAKKVMTRATLAKKEKRSTFDSDRFVPHGTVKSERHNGIDFENYQWRKVTDVLVVNGNKHKITFKKGHLVGVRFIGNVKGGILVTQEGLTESLKTDVYDSIVDDTQVYPKNRWPTGELSKEQVVDFWKIEKKSRKSARQEAARKEKERLRQEDLAKKLEQKEERRKKREAARAEREKFKRLVGQKPKIEKGKVIDERSEDAKFRDYKTDGAEELTVDEIQDLSDVDIFEDAPAPTQVDVKSESDEEPVDQTDDMEEGLSEISKELAKSSIRDVLGDESDDPEELDEEEGTEDDSEEEDFTDDEEDFDPDAEPDADGFVDADAEEESEEEDSTSEDTYDAEEDDDTGDSEEDDEESDLDEDESEDTGDSEEDDELAVDDAEDIDLESDEDFIDDDDTSDEEQDEDESEEADTEDDESEEEDMDADTVVDEAELDAPEETEDLPEQKTKEVEEEVEEGAILEFKKDSTDKRQFVVMDVSEHPKNPDILVYTVYDSTNKPDTVRKVRVAKGKSITDVATVKGQLKAKEFSKLDSEVESMDVDKEPIAS